MDRQSKIYIYSTISLLGLSFLGYRSVKRGQAYDLLIKKIADRNVIDNQKVNSVLNGVFHTNIGSNKDFAMLNEDKKRQASEKIANAFGTVNDDEEAIYSTIESLNDKVAISQVSAYFKAKNNTSLWQKFKDRLSPSEQAKVNRIINSKPDVRWLS